MCVVFLFTAFGFIGLLCWTQQNAITLNDKLIKNATILITGSKGFLGQKLCKLLMDKYNVNIISYDIIDGQDILNKTQLFKTCNNTKIDLIIHLAAVSNLNLYEQKQSLSQSINVIGTKNIIFLSEQHLHCPILFASTCCLYGNNKLNYSTETSPISPTEPYAKSKGISEIDILKSRENTNLSHVNMRLATFYGDNMRAALCPALFIQNIYNNKPLQIHGNGLQTRTYTFVDDIVTGIVCIAQHVLKQPFNFKYDTINITNGCFYDVWDIIKYSAVQFKNKLITIEMVKDRTSQFDQRCISNQRLCSLGWTPKYDLKTGMQKSVQFFKDNVFKWNR
eukprot:518834_1